MNRREFAGALAAFGLGSPRVPVYGHVGKSPDDFTGSELDFLARHFDFVTIEKGQAIKKYGQTEEGIYQAARQLKQRNPRMKVLFYWNAFLDYPLYKAREHVKPGWHLAARKNDRVPYYDLTKPDLREWWSDVAAEAMRKAPLDGIFADAALQVFARKSEELKQGLRAMLKLTRQKIGRDKIILANALRAGTGMEILDWDVSAVAIEHFGYFTSTDKESMAADLASMEAAARRGKIVVLKAWPGFSWLDTGMMKRPHEELAALAAQRIQFPLACFLAAARDNCYFCYSWGYREQYGTFDWYPELDRPLGQPKSEPRKDGWVMQREFEHASVRVDLESTTAKIDWR